MINARTGFGAPAKFALGPADRKENFMKKTKCSKIGFVFGTALLGALTGCVGYVDGPRHGYGRDFFII
jgi:hypothetical protein